MTSAFPEETSAFPEEYKQFIWRLKQARLDAQLNVFEVAGRLGETESYIKDCESGLHRVDIIELARFSQIYNKALNYFVEEF